MNWTGLTLAYNVSYMGFGVVRIQCLETYTTHDRTSCAWHTIGYRRFKTKFAALRYMVKTNRRSWQRP